VYITFTGFWWSKLNPQTGIMDVHFPSPLSENSRKNISAIRGLMLPFSRGPGAPSPTNGRGVRGFIAESVKFEEEETVVMRCFDYWINRDCELGFKDEGKELEEWPQARGVWLSFLAACRKEGMIGMPVERHCNFDSFPPSSSWCKKVSEDIWEEN
jgi:hypothetical protein